MTASAACAEMRPPLLSSPASADSVQTLRLNDAALTVVVEVVAIAQHTDGACLECAFDAGQNPATVIDIGGTDADIAVLGDDFTALVIEIAADIRFRPFWLCSAPLPLAGWQLRVAESAFWL